MGELSTIRFLIKFLQIKLVPNEARKFITYFNVDSWSQVSHRISIPLSHNCLLPDLVCTPSNVNIRFCFLHYLCQRLIKIKNRSGLRGKIWLYTEVSVIYLIFYAAILAQP